MEWIAHKLNLSSSLTKVLIQPFHCDVCQEIGTCYFVQFHFHETLSTLSATARKFFCSRRVHDRFLKLQYDLIKLSTELIEFRRIITN